MSSNQHQHHQDRDRNVDDESIQLVNGTIGKSWPNLSRQQQQHQHHQHGTSAKRANGDSSRLFQSVQSNITHQNWKRKRRQPSTPTSSTSILNIERTNESNLAVRLKRDNVHKSLNNYHLRDKNPDFDDDPNGDGIDNENDDEDDEDVDEEEEMVEENETNEGSGTKPIDAEQHEPNIPPGPDTDHNGMMVHHHHHSYPIPPPISSIVGNPSSTESNVDDDLNFVDNEIEEILSATTTTTIATNKVQCSNDQFRCNSSEQCLPITKRCDGLQHCYDGSDEANCFIAANGNLTQGKLLIRNFSFIHSFIFILFYLDCDDQHSFRCGDQICIGIELRCNGEHDCSDGSDEIECSCHVNQFQCKNMFQCIDNKLRCKFKPFLIFLNNLKHSHTLT